jgi:hypothetical protein
VRAPFVAGMIRQRLATCSPPCSGAGIVHDDFCKLPWKLGEHASPICTAIPATTGNPTSFARPTEVIDNATFSYRIAVQLAAYWPVP